MVYQAVVFDFFGTLTTAVRRGPAHARIARSLGCEPDRWVESLDRTFATRAGGSFGDPLGALLALASSAGGRPRTAAVHAAFADRIAAVRLDAPLRPDAVPVLAALRERGLRTAVLSDCWYELPAYFPTLPLAPLVDAAVFSYEIGYTKPHPAMYRTVTGHLGVAARDCLYVGDGGGRELTGAAAAGMRPVRLAAPDLVDHLAFDADEAFDGPSITSLVDVLEVVDPARTGARVVV